MIGRLLEALGRFPSRTCVKYSNGLRTETLACNQVLECVETLSENLGPEWVVGIFLGDQTSGMYVVPAILGVMRAKSTFYAVDPQSSLQQTIDLNCVICDWKSSKWVEKQLGRQVQRVNDIFGVVKIHHRPVKPGGEIIYAVQTSGTSSEKGFRKVVWVPRASIWPNVVDFAARFPIGPNGLIFAAAPVTFDPFYVDLFLSLLTNTPLLMVDEKCKKRPKRLAEILFEQHKTSYIQCTPTLYRSLKPAIIRNCCIQFLVLGGEPFPQEDIKVDQVQVFNVYGLTEMSCWQSMVQVDNRSSRPVPIYDSSEVLISETELTVQNSELGTRCEDHELGEIVITSKARKCLVQGQELGSIHTGDLGYWEQGRIYFAGRKDLDQFKVHGKRFCTGQVEEMYKNTLGTAVTLCLKYREGMQPLLYAFVVQEDASVTKLYDKCSNLPPYLRPYEIMPISCLPMNHNGKIDRNQLLALANHQTGSQFQLQDLWEKFTGCEPQSHSKLLEDGGDSYTAVLMASAIEEAMGEPNLDLVQVLLNGTFSELQEKVGPMDLVDLKTCKMKEEKLGSERADSLKLCWKVDLKKCIDASPLIIERNNAVYIGSHKGLFTSVDLTTGQVNWQIGLSGRIEATASTSPCQTKIYVGCYDKSMYCIGSTSGKVLWTFKTGGLVKSMASVTSSRVVFGSYDSHLYCLASEDGQMMWRGQVSPDSSILARPIVTDGSVLAASLNGSVVKFDLSGGQAVWRLSVGAPVFSSPVVFRGLLAVVANVRGLVTGLDYLNGQTLWTCELEANIFSSLASNLEDRVMFGGHDHKVYCLSLKGGKMIWTCDHSAPVYASPFVLELSSVMTLSTDGQLKILDITTGQCTKEAFLGQTEGQQDYFSSPVVFKDKVIVGSRRNHLMAFEI